MDSSTLLEDIRICSKTAAITSDKLSIKYGSDELSKRWMTEAAKNNLQTKHELTFI